jgi:hypothetical protein
VHGASTQLPNEGGEIGGVGRHRELGPVVRPQACAEVALGRRDEPIPLGYRFALAFPDAVIARGTVDEDHRYAVPLVQIGKIDAIHPHVLDLRCRNRSGAHVIDLLPRVKHAWQRVPRRQLAPIRK